MNRTDHVAEAVRLLRRTDDHYAHGDAAWAQVDAIRALAHAILSKGIG